LVAVFICVCVLISDYFCVCPEVGKNFGVDLVYSYPEICDDERIVYLNKIMKMQREREKGRSGGASGGGGFDKVNRFLRFRHRWVYIHLSGRAESDNV